MALKQQGIESSFNKEYLKIVWDVLVVGGGPAGMMAAIEAGKKGKKVLILEKNEKLGKKLLITGGGRCNVTNATFDNRELLKKYGEAEQYLYSAFSQYSVEDTIKFLKLEGVETKTEAERRMFPVSNKALSVWTALVQQIKQLYIQVHSNVSVKDLYIDKDSVIKGVVLESGEKVLAQSVIVATGGISHPETGSTGDGFKWLSKAGHTVHDPIPTLVPLAIKDGWVKQLQGITLTDIKLTVYRDDLSTEKSALIKEKSVKGKILFTHFGVSGPTILNMSKSVSDYLEQGDVYVALDLRPDLDHGTMNALIQKTFDENKNKQIKNALDLIIPSGMVPVVLQLAEVPGETMCNSIKREMRMKMIEVMKMLKMQVKGLLGDDKAVVSSGGVSLNEIDFKTMESKKIKGLFVVGDVLNIDRPSGGYSLQLCWTTGAVAGRNA